MGNRSVGRGVQGVPRTLVRMPGFLVQAEICVPRAHGHALWMLPVVERLLQGEPLQHVMQAPPWPRPPDPLVGRALLRTLIDLGWATPDWSGSGVSIAEDLRLAYEDEGRDGLAKRLFDMELIQGEWWADGLGGALLSRQTATQFDWDMQRRADVVLEPDANPQDLIDASEPDLADLIEKLNGVEIVWNARESAFLGTSLWVGERKDLLFPMFGGDLRLLPDELSELEPTLSQHAPELFGELRAPRSRLVRFTTSPVERLLSEIERLPADPLEAGPSALTHARVRRISELCAELNAELVAWIDEGTATRPVAGPTPRHFDALREMAERLSGERDPVMFLTSAFLNPRNVEEPEGLAAALGAAPKDTRILLVYGHASDDIPSKQVRDITEWRDALARADADLAHRVVVVAGERRSHEKVILSSVGDWMVGSWNPASSRPGALVFEASLAGQDPKVAAQLLGALEPNVAGEPAEALLRQLAEQLRRCPRVPREGARLVAELREAAALLAQAVPDGDDARAEAWRACVNALRAAFAPFLGTSALQLLDEHQTRDAFVTRVRAARKAVLLASDRLADSALDPATVRDLRSDGRSQRVVRLIWGREWAGRRPGDRHTREQLKHAAATVREARRSLGGDLLASETPMENHAKALIVDGLFGVVTSENLLSYGGEKGRYESRELGLAFRGPALSRELLGRFLSHWPSPLLDEGRSPDAALAWLSMGSEVWHALESIAEELDFDWRAPSFIAAAITEELSQDTSRQGEARSAAFGELLRRLGGPPGAWLRERGERLGVLLANPSSAWRPWEAYEPALTEALIDVAKLRVEALPKPEISTETPSSAATARRHPLVERVLDGMVRVPAGRFRMGDRRVRDDSPEHEVTISRAFLMAATPVTQGLWEEVMGRLPHLRDVDRHPEHPIIHIGRQDIARFLERLNALPGSGQFKLPTEAQWEYACRAGSDALYCFGDDPGSGKGPGPLERYAWTKRNSDWKMQRVGLLRPNAWGLYDMHGLVYETMRDGFRPFSRRPTVDPIGPLDADRIVARGGCWSRFPIDVKNPRQEHFRCAARQTFEKGARCSIRLIRTLEEDE